MAQVRTSKLLPLASAAGSAPHTDCSENTISESGCTKHELFYMMQQLQIKIWAGVKSCLRRSTGKAKRDFLQNHPSMQAIKRMRPSGGGAQAWH